MSQESVSRMQIRLRELQLRLLLLERSKYDWVTTMLIASQMADTCRGSFMLIVDSLTIGSR